MRYALLALIVASGVVVCLATGTPNAQRSERQDTDRTPATASFCIKGNAFGTTYSIRIAAPPAGLNETELRERVNETLQRIDREMSSYRDDSEIARFNAYRGTQWFGVSAETALVVAEARRIGESSGGAFDITVDPLVKLWGFGPKRHQNVPSSEAIARTRASVDYRFLECRAAPPALRKERPELSIDLGAIGKGYAVDALGQELETLGAANYLAAIGGELRARGVNEHGEAWRTGIERPVAYEREVQFAIELRDKSIATCGDYRNFYDSGGKRYSHIIDPKTGAPVAHSLASVSVICGTTMRADALGTALMVLGPENGWNLALKEDLAACFIQRDEHGLTVRATEGFKAAMKTLGRD